MKMKEIGPGRRGWVPSAPLDPPMICVPFRVFPILYWNSLIRWISLIQLKPAMTEGYWKFFCVLTVDSLVYWLGWLTDDL